jgi:hypothetical protein
MNYYIQGNKQKAEEIKAAFEKLGYDISWPGGCANPDVINIGVERNGAKYVVAETSEYIKDIIKTHPDYKELELPVEPCFKVGDKIEATIYGIERKVTIREVDKTNRCYFGTLEECIGFSEQDQWHLAPKPHYDIANFYAGMPVLVRADNVCRWDYSVFSRITGNEDWQFAVCNGVSVAQCIPFNNETKHLLGTNDPCGEEFINW